MNVPLLKKIIKAIQQEPRRLDMGDWINRFDRQAPCGTAACIAGYAVVLSLQQKRKGTPWAKAAAGAGRPFQIETKAKLLLGLDDVEARRLFHPTFWPDPFYLDDDTPREEQARLAVNRIKHFIKTEGEE